MIAEAVKAAETSEPSEHKMVTRVMLLRVALLAMFLLAYASLVTDDRIARYSLLALAFVVSVPYALWFRGLGLSVRATLVHLLLDLAVITVFGVLDGGPRSDVFLLYPLVIFSAAVVLPLRSAIKLALLCTVLLGLTVVASSRGWLSSMSLGTDSVPLYSLGAWLVAFALFLCAGVFVSRRCGYADARTNQVRRLAEILFKNLPAGLLLLDSDDRIELANDRACELFRQSERTLRNHRLVDLLAPGVDEKPWGASARTAMALRFRRPDGSLFPAHVDTGSVCLNPGLLEESQDADFTVVTITDISRLLEMQRRIQDTERLRTAASMATQIAHEVRNPVAAISGSAQVLDKLEKSSKAGDTVSDALLGTERTRLYDCIVSESTRLDEIIAKFLAFTDYSDEKLQTLLRLAEEAQPPSAKRPPVPAKAEAPAGSSV